VRLGYYVSVKNNDGNKNTDFEWLAWQSCGIYIQTEVLQTRWQHYADQQQQYVFRAQGIKSHYAANPDHYSLILIKAELCNTRQWMDIQLQPNTIEAALLLSDKKVVLSIKSMTMEHLLKAFTYTMFLTVIFNHPR
jgi:hypothetical protein